ncbi:hypothetical protein BXZ70DRAFT_63905 [Cristinia sonorae]|uniref:E3 ubiquitin-protein ligase listerin n=1 Tax=Cristinia sonorae TaxID=1940300 RepID=A0A8K0USF1_9AGAR|nr:hypothetical protein BXZ70DRAFT_63905 [Cristinia sonorae]
MAKGKSSATSGTRKKHAKKAAAASGDLEPQMPKEKKPKGKEKGKKGKEVRKKVYIPPVKPAPVLPDPLDTLGIAQRLSPELLVVLRRLSKKDTITKRRALEELQAEWIDKARSEEHRVHELVEAIPVWFHHVPSLFLHPSRRIRILAVGLHSSFLSLPNPVPDQLLFFLQEVANADQAELILGTWCMVAHDADRQLSSYARQSWEKFVDVSQHLPEPSSETAPSLPQSPSKKSKLHLSSASFAGIWGFVQRVTLDPGAIYLSINPPQPAAPPPPPQKKGGRPTPPVKKDDDSPTRSRGDEEEENELDRNARLRIGSLGAAVWVLNTLVRVSQDPKYIEDFLTPIDNAALWTTLHHAKAAPFVPAEIQSFGWNQPGVRKSAWVLLQTLLVTCKGNLKPLLATLASAVLRSAWVEPDPNVRQVMWKPLLTFLKEFPHAWEIEATSSTENDEDEEGSDDEDESAPAKDSKSQELLAKGYTEFLQFLELGCNGSPLQGYPAVLIVFSTIPSSVLASVRPPIKSLFTSLWAAIDGRALSGLDRAEASLAFVSSLLECTVFVARRIINDPTATVLVDGSPVETAQTLVAEQVTALWGELLSARLKVDFAKASDELLKMLVSLQKTDEVLFDSAWTSVASSVRKQLNATSNPISSLIPTSLKIFAERFEQGTHPSDFTSQLTAEVLQSIVAHIGDILEKNEVPSPEYLDSLLGVLDTFGTQLFQDGSLTQAIDETVTKHTGQIIALSPPLLFLYFNHRKNEDLCSDLWHSLLVSVAQDMETVLTNLPSLLDAVEGGSVPSYLRPKAEELDKAVSALLAEALTRYQADEALAIVKRVLKNPEPFISDDTYRGILSSVSETFSTHAEIALHDNPALPLETFAAPLSLLNIAVESRGVGYLPNVASSPLLPNVFLFAYLVPRYRTMDVAQKDSATTLWGSWLRQASDEDKSVVAGVIKTTVRDMLSDCFALAKPSHLVQLVAYTPGIAVNVLEEVFPSKNELDAMLDTLPTNPVDPSMAVLDPLIHLGDEDEDTSQSVVDSFGLSSYARIVTAMILYFAEDRHTAKQNPWALRHFLALSQYANEVIQVPSAKSAVFGQQISTAALHECITRVQQLLAYILVGSVEEGWLSNLLSGLSTGKRSPSYNGLSHLLHDLILGQVGRDNVREARILHTLLQHVLPQADVSKQDGDQLVFLGRKLESKAPHIALVILYSVTKYCAEPPRLDRYRNEVAANLFGVPASKANTEGLWLLRRLVAVSPDRNSDVIFLPTPRVVNLMKSCQQWITSDEGVDEEVELEMTSLFIHIAPILQNIPGAHWDFIFDIMENNLEGASLEDQATLPALARTLELFVVIQDLALTNKALRALWKEREHTQLQMLRDLIAHRLDTEKNSGPLSMCRELAISIIQDLPEALIVKETLPKMCHLVMDSSHNVQQMAYHMLREAAAKHTEHVVVEAAVDTEAEFKPELPSELIDILQRTVELLDEGDDVHSQISFGNLLTWMLIFDLFTNASLKVKSSYIEHLQRLDLVSKHFLPHVLGILGLYGGIAKAFKLDIWAVEEFYLDLYSSDTPHSLKLLAAHLYFRALMTVPSLFRTWLLDCRDRQLSTAVTTYTSNYFSPAIIRTELAQVKDPATTAELVDENMKIKVANAVSEVTASYAVDEYQLELKISLPPDWPLHSIEIQDKRIGVSEDRWRAWILGVRQILTFRSGSIVDGLSFFKKNVASHFEGQTECAICYSMISATDSSLPKKPCKTCKNRFHAGCLYKWFSTSHSSSCPLCRSEIMN